MSSPLHVYHKVNYGYNASIYYRQILPLNWMKRLKLPIMLYTDLPESTPVMERLMLQGQSDINFYYQNASADLLQLIRDMRKSVRPKPDAAGELVWPPSWVVSTDDDIFNTHPLNGSYGTLGFKDHDGKELPDGSKIWVRDPLTNAPRLLWADGENINLADNKRRLGIWREIMQESELVICSTANVEKYVKREAPDAKTHIFPNCIDSSEYPTIELADHPKEVRILWQGSACHHEDLWHLRKSFGNVQKKYPETHWIFWGVKDDYPWLTDYLDRDKVTMLPWVVYDAYKLRLSTINHDINICALTSHPFNDCRSAIKWYESSAICKPAATIAQRTAAYAEEIEEGKTGLLWDTNEEFETKLGGLIENANLRRELASNSADWVRTYRDPVEHVLALYERFLQVRGARKLWPEPAPTKVAKKQAKKQARKQPRKKH